MPPSQPGSSTGNGQPPSSHPAEPPAADRTNAETLAAVAAPGNDRRLDSLASPPRPAVAEQRAASVPVTVPGYEILGELGRGGMGVVYKARHVKLNRLVALKMILAGGHAGTEERRRFLTEAEAVARLQHPNVVPIYEVGECEGLPFLSLEYCAGGSLAGKLNGTPQAPGEAAGLVETLARAMHAAHQAGIVHRDLNPANVLLTAHGTPKVTDFGLAKKLGATAGRTASGAILGTPSYMAPEQAAGKGKEVGPAADVYALGAILYEMLTGRPPFKAATPMDTVLQVVSDEPVPPSRLQPKLPRDLETICLKCLQKESHERYASALDLAEDLRRFCKGEPIQARPVGAVERGWRWCRRNPAVAGSLAGVALVLLAATVISSSFGFYAEYARQAEAALARSEASAKQDAEGAHRETRRQLIDQYAASGLTAAREQDHSLALLWFARAVQLAKDEPPQQELNRIRVANWLRQVALPEDTFDVPGFRDSHDRFRAFRFSPDGKYLLVVSNTGNCLVWDRLGSRTVSLPGQAARGRAAVWEPKSGLLAVAEGNRIQLLSPPAFQPVEEVEASGSIAALAFSRDGQRLAWGAAGGARVWDRKKKEYTCPLLAHGGAVTTLAFSASGELLATLADDGKARVFRVVSRSPEPLFLPVAGIRPEHGLAHGGPDRVAPRFGGNDQVLLTAEGSLDSPQRLVWRSATTGKLLGSIPGAPGQQFLTAFAVTPGGDQVAALWESSGRLLNARTPGILAAIPLSHFDWSEDAVFADDGKTLVTCGHDTLAQIWAVDDRPNFSLTASAPPILHPLKLVRADLSPDGKLLATAQWDGTVCLWRLPKGLAPAYSVSAGGTTLPALSPDGQFFLPRGTTYRNGTQRGTRVYRTSTGEPAGPPLDPGGILLDAAFSPDGNQVATASSTGRTITERDQRLFTPQDDGGGVQLWDWRSGKRLAATIATPTEPRGLAFSPDGRLLAVVCADYHVLVADPAPGEILRRLDPGARTRPFRPNVWWGNGEARFSPDGRFLVTWEMAGPVHVWDPQSGRLLRALPHDERVVDLAFNPVIPTRLVTASRDTLARIWDVDTGKLLAGLPHPQHVSRVRFSPDGTEVLTACADGRLRVWDARDASLKFGLAPHPGLIDFAATADRRWLVTLGQESLQVTDGRTHAPAGPLYSLKGGPLVAMAMSSADKHLIIGGFSRSLTGYQLEAMTTPAGAPADALVQLAEVIAGRRILSQGNVVPLTSAEWSERWQRLQREGLPFPGHRP